RYYSMVKFPFDLYWNRIHEGQEFNSDYAKGYPILKAKVLKLALAHNELPINKEELKKIRKRTFLRKIKNFIFFK
ncbi:MAG TPA: hypothetical protein PLR98_13080, partial [Chitinophagaceae bacterium]|nr:hypothetical protein [Chitinophagaceae bacterium]